MASWLYRLFLIAITHLLFINSGLAQATTEVIETDLDRREIKIAKIDNEFIEVSPYLGILSIEDFDSSVFFGIRVGVHLNQHVFIEASYGQGEGDKTSFEEIIPQTQVTSDRNYKSWDVSIGWNIFPNESWLFGKAFKSDVYLVTGAGRTEFAEDKWFTWNIGVGYRLFLTDWLIYRIDVRDHIFNRDVFGEDDQTNNIEFSTGLSIFF